MSMDCVVGSENIHQVSSINATVVRITSLKNFFQKNKQTKPKRKPKKDAINKWAWKTFVEGED